MDEKSRNAVIEVLLRAMQAETDGYLFYQSAAKNSDDPDGKHAFEMMAKDELDHLHFLKAQHKALTESGEPDAKLKIGHPPGDLEKQPMFSDDFKSRVTQAHNEMSNLSIGIQLEQAQIDFYKRQAEEASHPVIKAFLNELAEWEQAHYHRFIRQQESLKEDYWFKGGFYPF
jgi:rubrerythrin